jgi:four helix bundle protein
MGSAFELDYHFLLAKDLGFLDPRKYRELEDKGIELRRMLASLIHKVQLERNQGP